MRRENTRIPILSGTVDSRGSKVRTNIGWTTSGVRVDNLPRTHYTADSPRDPKTCGFFEIHRRLSSTNHLLFAWSLKVHMAKAPICRQCGKTTTCQKLPNCPTSQSAPGLCIVWLRPSATVQSHRRISSRRQSPRVRTSNKVPESRHQTFLSPTDRV